MSRLRIFSQLARRAAAAFVLVATTLPMAGVAHAAQTLTFTLVSGPSPSVAGQQVGLFLESNLFTLGSSPVYPFGTATLYDGGTQVAQKPCGIGYGQSSGSTSTYAVVCYFSTILTGTGTHILTASYTGDPNYVESADTTYNQEVDPAATTSATYSTRTAVYALDYSGSEGLGSFNIAYGELSQGLAFTYADGVPPQPPYGLALGSPTGEVSISLDGAPLANAPFVGPYGAQNEATFAIPPQALGTHSLAASYGGDSTFSNMSFSPSVSTSFGSPQNKFTVVASPTATTLDASASGNIAVLSSTVAPSFTVGPNTYPGCSQFPITGSVNFMEGSNVIASGTLNDSVYTLGTFHCHEGMVSAVSGTLSPGPHTITAEYAGDGNFLGSMSGLKTVTTAGNPIKLILPSAITVNATGPGGATVTYSVSYTGGDGSVEATCNPPSGSEFAVGTTSVACSATDLSEDTASGNFDVNVIGAAGQLGSLGTSVTGVGPGGSLAGKIATAQSDLATAPPNTSDACQTLGAFMNEVTAQTGKSITTAQAAGFIQQAKQIEAVLDC
jgi:hypothetical protein